MSVVYVQMNNDYSGSTFALNSILNHHKGFNKYLITSLNTKGFLSEINESDLFQINIPYEFKGKNFLTLLRIIQCWLLGSYSFYRLIRRKKVDLVYLNTILPWHIGFVAKMFRIPVIYHVHEFYAEPSLLVRFYLAMMKITANRLIFVSEDCAKRYRDDVLNKRQISCEIQYTPIRYSTIDIEYLNTKEKFHSEIIMVCSPKAYKGVEVFIDLAILMPARKFHLFLASEYLFTSELPDNMQVTVGETNLKRSLRTASVLLNLSQFPKWIETFGLTIWEALSQGTPVIVPDVGGPAEIVNVECGFSIDVREVEKVNSALISLFSSEEKYAVYCKEAVKRSKELELKYPVRNPV